MRELETKRLCLRAIRETDAQRMFNCWKSRPEVTKYLTWTAHERVEETQRMLSVWIPEYENPDCIRYGIELKEIGELIGMIDVVGYREGRPILGYCSGPDYWGNGYMTEALHAVTQELFALGHEEILIEAMEENIRSRRVIEKNGFEYTGSYEKPQSSFKPQVVTICAYRLRKG